MDELNIISAATVIFTEPFTDKGTEIDDKGGFARISQKHGLTELKVVFGNKNYLPGTFVYVRSDAFKQMWAQEKYKLMNKTKEVIVVPVDQILLSSTESIK
jgi:hypothetical protein